MYTGQITSHSRVNERHISTEIRRDLTKTLLMEGQVLMALLR